VADIAVSMELDSFIVWTPGHPVAGPYSPKPSWPTENHTFKGFLLRPNWPPSWPSNCGDTLAAFTASLGKSQLSGGSLSALE